MDKFQKKKYSQKKKIVRYSDVDALEKRIKEETPKQGDYLFDYKLKEIGGDKDKMDHNEFTRKYKINFKDLPLSSNTVNGLNKRKFIKLTEVQRCTIPHALAGRDIMGASKTGSGKTLAYLIPLVEKLYRNKWTEWDGLGALVILPTRELAMQVFEVLRSISDFHEISMGLIIGGKKVDYEKENIHRMNILIATPGRLLQHMDESPGFTSDNLQMLVIDEADMIFEMGFQETLNAIITNLPQQRQTLLFSATLSKNVHHFGKLSLKEPEYVFLHDKSMQKKKENNEEQNENQEKDEKTQKKQKMQDLYETPHKLMQYYMPINIDEKLNALFSFLKAHQKSKVLVFFSTCKQVRLAYETFKKLKVGLPILELHGRQKTNKRMALFYTYTEKKHACLFTTNIAARGLDFPSVNWVIQVDLPENCETYVHRIGRTARYKADGKSLIFLTPKEEKFVEQIKEKGINLHKLLQNPAKMLTITSTLQAFCSEDMDIKHLAQRAFVSYLKFVHLNGGNGKNPLFDVHSIPIKEFAESLGLVQTPIIKFKKNNEEQQKQEQSEESENDQEISENSDNENQQGQQQEQKKLTKFEKLKLKRQQEREQRKNKKNKIDIIHMKEEEQELEQKVYKELQQTKKISEKFAKLKQRTTNIFDKNNLESDNDDSDEEFFTKKQTSQKTDLEDLEKEVEEENKKKNQLPRISKRQLKKIKLEGGHFGGANIKKIDDDGNLIDYETIKAQEIKQYLKNVEDEEETTNLALKYTLKKELNEDKDNQIYKDRIKEKAIKRKQKQQEKEIEKMGGAVAMLGEDDQSMSEEE